MSALAAYEAGLRTGESCWLRAVDGSVTPLPLRRWLEDADASDDALLDSCTGPTLDVGCGPGRLTVALGQRDVPALGIDVAAEAVRLTRARGAQALRRDVFKPVPGQGRWEHVLLADGNIGIGGNPMALLTRVRELLAPTGTAVIDVEPPGTGLRRGRWQLVSVGQAGGPLDWAWVGADVIGGMCAAAGLRVLRLSEIRGRWVAEIGRGHVIPGSIDRSGSTDSTDRSDSRSDSPHSSYAVS